MFVHDGLVHKRFPVGPIANVPYFRRVAAAHKVSNFTFIFNNSTHIYVISYYYNIIKPCLV